MPRTYTHIHAHTHIVTLYVCAIWHVQSYDVTCVCVRACVPQCVYVWGRACICVGGVHVGVGGVYVGVGGACMWVCGGRACGCGGACCGGGRACVCGGRVVGGGVHVGVGGGACMWGGRACVWGGRVVGACMWVWGGRVVGVLWGGRACVYSCNYHCSNYDIAVTGYSILSYARVCCGCVCARAYIMHVIFTNTHTHIGISNETHDSNIAAVYKRTEHRESAVSILIITQ